MNHRKSLVGLNPQYQCHHHPTMITFIIRRLIINRFKVHSHLLDIK